MQSFDRVEPISPEVAELCRDTVSERHPPKWIEESTPTTRGPSPLAIAIRIIDPAPKFDRELMQHAARAAHLACLFQFDGGQKWRRLSDGKA